MLSFYIVEDDRSISKILRNIIKENSLGEVIGFSDLGSIAIPEILEKRPDIVLLDYLLPDADALHIIDSISKDKSQNIIIISEVSSPSMISQAYKKGIDFFINKPINIVEVVSVINKLSEHLSLKKALGDIQNVFTGISPNVNANSNESIEHKIKKQVAKLGILGENGTDDLIRACTWVHNNNSSNYKLSDVYKSISSETNSSDYSTEQRIRRSITKAFNELAEIGSEDYYNETFERFAFVLFDYSDMKKQMQYISNNKGESGKINIKKFLEGISILM